MSDVDANADIAVTADGGIAYVRLQRPDRHNALTADMRRRLGAVARDLASRTPADLRPARVVDGTALDGALDLASACVSAAPLAVRGTKRALDEGARLSPADAGALELKIAMELAATDDAAEGVRAFHEGRRPLFKGS